MPITGQCTGCPGDLRQDGGGAAGSEVSGDGVTREHAEEAAGTLMGHTTCQLVLESQERLPGAQGLGRLGGKGLSPAARSGPLPTRSSRRAVQMPAARSPCHAHLLSHRAHDGGKQRPGRPFPGAQFLLETLRSQRGTGSATSLKGASYQAKQVLNQRRDFPGSRVVKTLHFNCQGPRFNPRSESEDPPNHTDDGGGFREL